MPNEHNRPSMPPPATNLQMLAADLLAVAAKRVVEQLACGNWEPMQQLKVALDTYEHARIGDAITNAQDPQACTVANWADERSPDTLKTGEVSHA